MSTCLVDHLYIYFMPVIQAYTGVLFLIITYVIYSFAQGNYVIISPWSSMFIGKQACLKGQAVFYILAQACPKYIGIYSTAVSLGLCLIKDYWTYV